MTISQFEFWPSSQNITAGATPCSDTGCRRKTDKHSKIFCDVRLEKRLQTGLGPTKDQGVHVMSAFIGVHCFKVHHMTHHLKL